MLCYVIQFQLNCRCRAISVAPIRAIPLVPTTHRLVWRRMSATSTFTNPGLEASGHFHSRIRHGSRPGAFSDGQWACQRRQSWWEKVFAWRYCIAAAELIRIQLWGELFKRERTELLELNLVLRECVLSCKQRATHWEVKVQSQMKVSPICRSSKPR
jgi:hypothetical protein